MRQLVSHSLKMHKVQSISVIISVALSAMILVTLGLMYSGVQNGIETSEAQAGADVMAIPTDSLQYIDDTELLYTGAPATVYMDKSIVDTLASVEGVVKVSPQFFGQTLNSGCCSTTGETRLIGIDPSSDFVVTALAGADAVAALGDNALIVGSEVGGVNNNEITLYNEKHPVVAVMAETGTSFDQSIIGNIDMVRDLSRDLEGYDFFWEKNGDPADLVSCVMIDVDDDNAEQAITSVKAKINLSDIASPLVRSDTVDKARAQLQSVFFLLAAAAIIMAIVMLLQLFARFYSSVWDRKSELALYRALGASKGHLRKLVIYEVGTMVGIGLVVGIVLGFAAQGALLGVMQSGLAFPYMAPDIPAAALIAVAIVVAFVLVSLISIAVPLRQIALLDPAAAMQQGDID